MKHDFFKARNNSYHVSSYFYRIEFQQRGAPHVHSLLWMADKENKEAPNFCNIPDDPAPGSIIPDCNIKGESTNSNTSQTDDPIKARMLEVEEFADSLSQQIQMK